MRYIQSRAKVPMTSQIELYILIENIIIEYIIIRIFYV
jgi:hypothetical protein